MRLRGVELDVKKKEPEETFPFSRDSITTCKEEEEEETRHEEKDEA